MAFERSRYLRFAEKTGLISDSDISYLAEEVRIDTRAPIKNSVAGKTIKTNIPVAFTTENNTIIIAAAIMIKGRPIALTFNLEICHSLGAT
jgi:hypothetical protein